MQSHGAAGCAARPAVPRRPGHRQGHRAELPTRSCRASGVAWDPTGDGQVVGAMRATASSTTSSRTASGTASQVAISATPCGAVQPVQRRRPELPEPVSRAARTRSPNTFVRPSTVFALDADAKPPYASRTGTSACSARSSTRYLVEVRYVGADGHAPAAQRRSEPGRVRPRRDGAERRPAPASTPTARATAAPATSPPSRCCATSPSVDYHAGQASLSRRFGAGVGFNVSYWLSKSIDYLSAMNLSGAAAKPLAGENDLAQNPFDLEAGARAVAVRRAPPLRGQRAAGSRTSRTGARRRCGRCSTAGRSTPSPTHNSGTPFTVSDSANVALQANSPPISGLSRQPAEPGRRSERRAAHGRGVAQPSTRSSG